MNLRFLPEVYDDVAAAVTWYTKQGGTEVGRRLVDSLFAVLPRVAQSPERFHCVYGEFRRVLIKPFPYNLFFKASGDLVVIVLLIHSARDPALVSRMLEMRSRKDAA